MKEETNRTQYTPKVHLHEYVYRVHTALKIKPLNLAARLDKSLLNKALKSP